LQFISHKQILSLIERENYQAISESGPAHVASSFALNGTGSMSRLRQTRSDILQESHVKQSLRISLESQRSYTNQKKASNCQSNVVENPSHKNRDAKFLQKSHHPHISPQEGSQQFLHNKHPLDPACPTKTIKSSLKVTFIPNLLQFLPTNHQKTFTFSSSSSSFTISSNASQILNEKQSTVQEFPNQIFN
jgi:hypothetical protein